MAVELPHPGLRLVVERDAGAPEGAEKLVERVPVLLVGVDLPVVDARLQRLQAREQPAVQVDGVLMLGEAGRHLLVDGVQLR